MARHAIPQSGMAQHGTARHITERHSVRGALRAFQPSRPCRLCEGAGSQGVHTWQGGRRWLMTMRAGALWAAATCTAPWRRWEATTCGIEGTAQALRTPSPMPCQPTRLNAWTAWCTMHYNRWSARDMMAHTGDPPLGWPMGPAPSKTPHHPAPPTHRHPAPSACHLSSLSIYYQVYQYIYYQLDNILFH